MVLLLGSHVSLAEETQAEGPQAEESAEVSAQATVEASTDDDRYFIEQQNYRRLVSNEEFLEASNSAKRLVVFSIERYGRDSMETAAALSDLGQAQRESGDVLAARENFESAIEIIEDKKDRLSEELISPLTGLGRANLQGNRPDSAADAYERALHVSQVNEGPQNLEQVGLLSELTDAYYQLGDFKQADALQRYTVGLYQRRYPAKDDDRLVPVLYERARWLNRMGQIVKEQAVYQQIIRIVEKADGRSSLNLIPALTALGKSYVYGIETEAHAIGERRLRRAISIAKKNDEASNTLKADTLIALADYNLLTGDRTAARRGYVRAWDEFDEESLEDLDARDDRFASPTPLSRQDRGPADFKASVAEFEETYGGSDRAIGHVTVGYDVTISGSTRNLVVIESVPAGYKDAEALAWVRRFKFRPQVVDRTIVETPDQAYRYEFTYVPSADDEVMLQQADDAAATTDES